MARNHGARDVVLTVFGVMFGLLTSHFLAIRTSTGIVDSRTLEKLEVGDAININLTDVLSYRQHLRLHRVGGARKEWAMKKYQLDEPPGTGHYALLGYLSSMQTHSVVVDVGTRWGDSARALASEPSNFIFTFDVMNAADRIAKANSLSVGTLEEKLGNVQFFQNTNILQSRKGRSILRVARLIMLDTLHAPDENKFEYMFLDFLVSISFKGLLICDDIHLNTQMEKWWSSINVKKFDLTRVGHNSGTGLVDFSGKIAVQV